VNEKRDEIPIIFDEHPKSLYELPLKRSLISMKIKEGDSFGI
jgi:hypothetical protein